MRQPTLFETADAPDPERPAQPPDQPARDFAVDPSNHVVLEASAGTGKTRVLVDRYIRLLGAGVDPRHILAITFTRKAAAEMRERVLAELRRRGESGTWPADRWQVIKARMTQIEISTIDAFCFGLLREFPIEADVDPAFDIADETEMGRFGTEALDLTFRIARPLIVSDEHVRLLFARVKPPVLREALATLLDRRHVARPAIQAFLDRRRDVGTATDIARLLLRRVRSELEPPAAFDALVDDGPQGAVEFAPVAAQLRRLRAPDASIDISEMQAVRMRLERYFLTQAGKARQKLSKPFASQHFANADARRRHELALSIASPRIKEALEAFDADLDVLLARGLQRMLQLTVRQFTRLLEEHALLDFAGMLDRAVTLLERQEEFARSRLKLQSRYHHLLVDEFQDTSRRQWRLIELLIDAWAEGEGLADAPTSVFIVGDRKQSIYRFRHAEVTLLDEAAGRIGMLRPGTRVRHAITTSFRAVPELLAFVNAMSSSLSGDPELEDRWRYDPTDRFPVPAVSPGARRDGRPVLGLVAEPTLALSAAAVAGEIESLLATATVRERSGGPRPIRPDDIAILFRTRAGHQVFEEALERRGIQTYVYKGLGFFDAPEVQDLQALIRFLAQPDSDLRAAELLRSRLIRLSDVGLERLAPRFATALTAAAPPPLVASLSDVDGRLLAHARASLSAWLTLADRLPPSEVIDLVLRDSAYASELRGRRLGQARENVKKLRALVRRVENRGYTTFGRLAAYFETLRSGDDSNAIVEAVGSVNLMTMHAAKGLEFPVVFLVNLHMGGRSRTGGVSVIERGRTGEAEVTFGASDATRLEDARETEELRRLLYVAITRARDRLYLAGEVDAEGRLRKGQRSLAALLPASLAATFAAASAPATTDQIAAPRRAEVEWVADEGTFAFSVCIPPLVTPLPVEPPGVESPAVTMPAELIVDGRIAATAAIIGNPGATLESHRPVAPFVPASETLVGTLVHRCFARGVDAATADPAATVEQCLSPDERIDVSDPLALGTRALAVYANLRDDPGLRALLSSGQVLYEVPFCYRPPGEPESTLRGVIDCLILGEIRAVVVEFKTGSPRPEHQAQTELYRLAVAAIMGDLPVDVRVFYPNT